MMLPRDEYRFCPACGGSLELLAHEFIRFRCPKCGKAIYLNPKVGVALVIEADSQLLLVRRKEEPFAGWWTLPSGYVEYEESCKQAALREAQEELSLEVYLTRLLGVYSYQDDPRANMVLVVYCAECDDYTFRAGDDAAEVRLFRKNELPPKIAFSGIRQAIQEYLDSDEKVVNR